MKSPLRWRSCRTLATEQRQACARTAPERSEAPTTPGPSGAGARLGASPASAAPVGPLPSDRADRHRGVRGRCRRRAAQVALVETARSGRCTGTPPCGGDGAAGTFDTRREALAWYNREKAALDGGVDPASGKRRVEACLDDWLAIRADTVAKKTAVVDRALKRLTPIWFLNMGVRHIGEREVARVLEDLVRQGLAEGSVKRYRASLSSFFGWCVREKYFLVNPVSLTRAPRSSDEPTEMLPFAEEELEVVWERWAARNRRLADIMLLLGWTGLRWAEARAVRVGDVMKVPTPGLVICRSNPEGVGLKSTKRRRSRLVPLADRVLDIVAELSKDKAATDLLCTTDTGSPLHRSAVVRTLAWEATAAGRRTHDLRHTAAGLWLARGVDPGTVQAWLGHESIATTNRYLHYLGTGAHRAGLERLNAPRGNAGAMGTSETDTQ